MVILNAWNIWTSYVKKSLDHKNFGLFKIIKVINNSAYKLKLSPSMNSIFPVFYLQLFHLNKSDFLFGQIILPLPPIWFDEDIGLRKYIAKEILDSRINKRIKDLVSKKRRCLMYKIKFTGRDEQNANPDWHIWINTAGCQNIVADFHYKNKEKSDPHPSFQIPEDWEPVLDLLRCKNTMSPEFHP